MDIENAPTTMQPQVVVSDDAMQAWIEIQPPASPDELPPTEEDVLNALSDEHIALTDDVQQRLAIVLATITPPEPAKDATDQGTPEEAANTTDDTPGDVDPKASEDGEPLDNAPPSEPQRFLIAEGRGPVEAIDGEIEWFDEFKESRPNRKVDADDDAPVDYYSRNTILTLEAECPIGRLREAVDGCDGCDVRGGAISPQKRKAQTIQIGHGLRVTTDEPKVVVTEVAGRVMHEGNKLWIDEVLTISGDVDFKSGNVDAVIDVHILGDVRPKFQVRSRRSVVVDAAVEAATVTATDSIEIRHGVFGQESGCRLTAGGNVTAQICDGVTIHAGQDVCVGKEIINCTIRARGTVRADGGAIIGGDVWGREGVKVKVLGSASAVATRVAAGTDGAVLAANLQRDHKARKIRKQMERVREHTEMMAASARRLTPAQQEIAKKLAAHTKQLDQDASALDAESAEALEAAAPSVPAAIEVGGMLHPGVHVVFGLREAMVLEEAKGPIRIVEREIDDAVRIVIVSDVSDAVTVLPTTDVDLAVFQQTADSKKA